MRHHGQVKIEPEPTASPPEPTRPEIILPTEFRNVVLTGILALLILYTLYFARAVFVPLLIALLLRLFLQLPLNFLTRLGIPRLIAVLSSWPVCSAASLFWVQRSANRPQTGSHRRRGASARYRTDSNS